MMKKLLTAIAFTGLAAVALASFMGAFGSGTIQVGSNTGVFGLSVRQGDNHTFGSAGYAELTPSHTVASYITMGRVANATFSAHSVDFSGPGRMWAAGTFTPASLRQSPGAMCESSLTTTRPEPLTTSQSKLATWEATWSILQVETSQTGESSLASFRTTTKKSSFN